MTAKRVHIKSVARYPIQEDSDSLSFLPGVNVIVGELQAGKSTWLRMIDYALGDTGKLESAFDTALALKYQSVSVILVIDSEEYLIERRWSEGGARSKVFVNGEKMGASEFSTYLLGKLNIPLIHIPSGNPYERAWVELSWRELFRHMYKSERPWSGFAEKQPDATRSACILHFLGSAEDLYPEQLSHLIALKKQRDRIEAQKDVFVGVMQGLGAELVGQSNISVAITPDSITSARARLSERLVQIDAERVAAIQRFDDSVPSPLFEESKSRLTRRYELLGELEAARNDAVRRKAELTEYRNSLEAELIRFSRVRVGGEVFADLKVTHCPVCDKTVKHAAKADQCYLCGQFHPTIADSESPGSRRVEFEEAQIREEVEELHGLSATIENELAAFAVQIDTMTDAIALDARSVGAATWLAVRGLPADLSLLDVEQGEIAEQLQQLSRVERALGAREEMTASISELEEQIAALDIQVRQRTPLVDFAALSDLLSDKMNHYLNQVNLDALSRWKAGLATVKLRRDSFEVLLKDQQWTLKAGGTAGYLIQIAYHYALLSLTKRADSHYPGLLILDFPPHFSKADDLRDSENYLLKPFVELCAQSGMANSQVIIAGRAFDNLQGANILHL